MTSHLGTSMLFIFLLLIDWLAIRIILSFFGTLRELMLVIFLFFIVFIINFHISFLTVLRPSNDRLWGVVEWNYGHFIIFSSALWVFHYSFDPCCSFWFAHPPSPSCTFPTFLRSFEFFPSRTEPTSLWSKR